MSKKRKEATSSQSTTLLDFFGKGGSPANKRPKTRTQTQSRSKKSPVKRERFTVAPEDIIIIDSDDENDFAVKPEPLDVTSSDVEIVDEPLSRSKSLSRLTDSHSENVSPTKAASSFKDAELLNALCPQEDTNESFGIPYLLLERGDEEPEDFTGEFGTPTLLNDPPGDGLHIPKECSVPCTTILESTTNCSSSGRPNPASNTSNEKQSGIPNPKLEEDSGHHNDLGVIEISDDEWGTGDDEMAVENSLNLDADTSTTRPDIDLTLDDDPIEDVTPGSETCPICGLLFDALSHVVSTP